MGPIPHGPVHSSSILPPCVQQQLVLVSAAAAGRHSHLLVFSSLQHRLLGSILGSQRIDDVVVPSKLDLRRFPNIHLCIQQQCVRPSRNQSASKEPPPPKEKQSQ